MSASIGWSYAEAADDIDKLLRRADEALRAAKSSGKRQAVNFAALAAMPGDDGDRNGTGTDLGAQSNDLKMEG